ncbi:HupE/UreJ family protein [Ancylomarina sp. 16SWW S1-10-2]|uniref:HupE/UreJ family protein n=1 Tax=Ancylomarina sp. 16SWW S1-10-2 TaxID=2499681 RepID=UPI0012ADF21D|nr:HupE/UreJ family protein [Ancylomarina sp. 16SWW S1-10-2]MRT94216.1 hypothetical protein [Ancylomarina sp. 16SWW S1-10-2]
MDKLFYSFEIAFKHLCQFSAIHQILFLIIIGAFFSFKDWKTYLLIVLALCSGSILGLSLAIFKAVSLTKETINLLAIVSLIIVSLNGIFSNRITTLHYNIFVLIGIMQGFVLSLHYKAILGSSFKFTSYLGYNLGSFSSFLLISFLSLLVCTLIITVFKTDKHKISLVLAGLGLGVASMMYF